MRKPDSKIKMALPIVEIKAVTWNKDSHGLFDYENNFYDMKKFAVSSSIRISRQRNEIFTEDKNSMVLENEEEKEYLMSISQDTRKLDSFHVEWLNKPACAPPTSRWRLFFTPSLISGRRWPCC